VNLKEKTIGNEVQAS